MTALSKLWPSWRWQGGAHPACRSMECGSKSAVEEEKEEEVEVEKLPLSSLAPSNLRCFLQSSSLQANVPVLSCQLPWQHFHSDSFCYFVVFRVTGCTFFPLCGGAKWHNKLRERRQKRIKTLNPQLAISCPK